MIKINGFNLKPTTFPDGTSQVWRLPKELLDCSTINLVWHFDGEAEIMHLASLRQLLGNRRISLHVPYLPYARQDKEIGNETTFNLRVFADMLNDMSFDKVSTIDVHSHVAHDVIPGLLNFGVSGLHNKLIQQLRPDYIVYPDLGARDRYNIQHDKRIVFYKSRDQLTGDIIGHDISYRDSNCGYTQHMHSPSFIDDGDKFLIVDDICDGGATFIGIAKKLKQSGKSIEINLFVTHGIFSKGRKVLEDEGIKIFTTNSLLKNTDGFEV